MIGFLSGTLISKNIESVLINVTGVGYEVEVPTSTLCALPHLESEVRLYVYTHVREDAIRLFGFLTAFDKKVFQELIQVSGIGPKAALSLLGPVDGPELCEIISSGQTAKLTSIPGIGLKTAERLVLELKTKLQKRLFQSNMQAIPKEGSKALYKHVMEDLKSALVNLGYKDKQFEKIVRDLEYRMDLGENIALEAALKESLQKLSGHILQKNSG